MEARCLVEAAAAGKADPTSRKTQTCQLWRKAPPELSTDAQTQAKDTKASMQCRIVLDTCQIVCEVRAVTAMARKSGTGSSSDRR